MALANCTARSRANCPPDATRADAAASASVSRPWATRYHSTVMSPAMPGRETTIPNLLPSEFSHQTCAPCSHTELNPRGGRWLCDRSSSRMRVPAYASRWKARTPLRPNRLWARNTREMLEPQKAQGPRERRRLSERSTVSRDANAL